MKISPAVRVLAGPEIDLVAADTGLLGVALSSSGKRFAHDETREARDGGFARGNGVRLARRPAKASQALGMMSVDGLAIMASHSAQSSRRSVTSGKCSKGSGMITAPRLRAGRLWLEGRATGRRFLEHGRAVDARAQFFNLSLRFLHRIVSRLAQGGPLRPLHAFLRSPTGRSARRPRRKGARNAREPATDPCVDGGDSGRRASASCSFPLALRSLR